MPGTGKEFGHGERKDEERKNPKNEEKQDTKSKVKEEMEDRAGRRCQVRVLRS